MKCPGCGRENRLGADFCAWCGMDLEMGEAPPEVQRANVGATDEVSSESEADIWRKPAGPAVAQGTDEPIPIAHKPSDALPLLPRPTIRLTEPAALKSERLPAAKRGPDAEGATPLRADDILAGRYRILEVTHSASDANEYRAEDLCRCAACGYDGNAPDDPYCGQCGAVRAAPPRVRIVEQVLRPPERYDVHFSEDRRDYYVALEQPVQAPPEEPPALERLRLEWGHATHPGMEHDINEDYIDGRLYEPSRGETVGLFVVADGLGGQDSGEVASRLAAETVWEQLREAVWEPILRGKSLDSKSMETLLRDAVVAANRAVYEARTAHHSEMSTTLTLALIVGNVAHIANVGDSRTYAYDAKGLRRLTKDHSLVERLVDTGEITRAEVYSHPRRNLIYQSIGDRPDVQVDLFQHVLAADDRLVLCSDGLWEMVRDEGIEEVLLAEPDPQRAADRLVRDANLAGGDDNISAIIVQVRVS